MDAYAVERSSFSNEMLRLVAGLQSALTLEEVERAYLSKVVGVHDADGHGLYALDPPNRFGATGQRVGLLPDVVDHLPRGVVVSSADGETIFVNSVAASRQPCSSFADMVASQVREAREALRRDNRRIVTANVVQ